MSLGRTASSRPARREAPAAANCWAGSRGQHQEGRSAQKTQKPNQIWGSQLRFHRRGLHWAAGWEKTFKKNYIYILGTKIFRCCPQSHELEAGR